eukprot:956547-Prymnesium_polylepis.1
MSIAGIPIEALPKHVQDGLKQQSPLELALSADAIETVLGANAELVMSKVKGASSVLSLRLGAADEDSVSRRVSILGTPTQLLEAHRLIRLALYRGEPERLTTKVLLPRRFMSSVLGENGATVREISRQSAAQVVVDRQPPSVRGGEVGLEECMIRVSGGLPAVSNALAQVLLLRIDCESDEGPPQQQQPAPPQPPPPQPAAAMGGPHGCGRGVHDGYERGGSNGYE